mmetsp:Transcript_85924/g.179615  ORF Transcript_85924/g.179615 Transcript_85924/m.179615 type:complete len:172 (-) Transcript_85924:421-936(-)
MVALTFIHLPLHANCFSACLCATHRQNWLSKTRPLCLLAGWDYSIDDPSSLPAKFGQLMPNLRIEEDVKWLLLLPCLIQQLLRIVAFNLFTCHFSDSPLSAHNGWFRQLFIDPMDIHFSVSHPYWEAPTEEGLKPPQLQRLPFHEIEMGEDPDVQFASCQRDIHSVRVVQE